MVMTSTRHNKRQAMPCARPMHKRAQHAQRHVTLRILLVTCVALLHMCGMATMTAEAVNLPYDVSKRAARVRSVCLSPFKCDEEVDEIKRKMERSHFRFGNFPQGQRSCIEKTVRHSYHARRPNDCIPMHQLDRSISRALGMCIIEIHAVRRLKPTDESRVRQLAIRDAQVARQRADAEPPSFAKSLVPHARALPFGSPLRRVARFVKLEHVSERQWTYTCTTGKHWCCVFIGDDQSNSCFGFWCYKYPAEDLRCY